jgi:tRNA (mo5U34)-methyltransferase
MLGPMATSQVAGTDDLKRRVAEIRWFHQIDLGNGLVTPGIDESVPKLDALRMPNLTGKSVLDIGANDGFFSFAAERAGAKRVVAVDSFSWSGEPPGNQTKAGFDLAHEVLESRVEPHQADLYELTPESIGTFDVVMMLGVLYHVRDPLLALERVASLTNELLLLETLVARVWARRPLVAFCEDSLLEPPARRPPWRWWGPNPAAVVGMLTVAGFRDVEIIGRRSLLGKVGHTAYSALNIAHSRIMPGRDPLNWGYYIGTDRAFVHARR